MPSTSVGKSSTDTSAVPLVMGRHVRLHLELESFVQTPGTVSLACTPSSSAGKISYNHVPRTRTVTLVMGRQVRSRHVLGNLVQTHPNTYVSMVIDIRQARLPSSKAGKSRADTTCSTAGDVRPRLVLESIVQKSRAVSLVKFQAEWYLVDDSIRVFSYKMTNLFCSHVKISPIYFSKILIVNFLNNDSLSP